ncbi:MAG TPA: hypothetical protein VHJ20_00245 [Polyangia bacterium]|nr:hypothetical protein [Polyangia bacterium]
MRKVVARLAVGSAWLVLVACGNRPLDKGQPNTSGETGGTIGSAGLGGGAGHPGSAATTGSPGSGGTGGLGVGGFANGGTGGVATGGGGGIATGGTGAHAMGGFGGFVMTGFGGSPSTGTGGFMLPPEPCRRGSLVCDAARSEQHTCQDDLTWSGPTTCFLGCAGNRCADCKSGTHACNNRAAQTCVNGHWTDPTSCGADVCTSNGVCGKPPECEPSTTTCIDDVHYKQCQQDGTWGPSSECPLLCIDHSCGGVPKTVFVSSQLYVGGELGGLAGADLKCQQLAQAAGLPGQFLAWLSDSSGASPSTRFNKIGPYVLTEGTLIARTWAELTAPASGTLRAAINLTEFRVHVSMGTNFCGGPIAWTDTKDDGTLFDKSLTCGDWKNPQSFGSSWGKPDDPSEWTQGCDGSASSIGPLACQGYAALYCFQQ